MKALSRATAAPVSDFIRCADRRLFYCVPGALADTSWMPLRIDLTAFLLDIVRMGGEQTISEIE
jgi:hypothetical protein